MEHSNLYYRDYNPLLKRAGLEDQAFTFHALRHTFATALFACGEDPKVVQSLSLRFKQEQFCDGIKPIAKLSGSQFTLAQALFLRAG